MNQHPYDLLTPDTVIDAVESTGRLSDARLLALNSYENRVYQVGIEGGEPLIAKFYRPQRWSLEPIGRIVGPETMKFPGWQRLVTEYSKQFGTESR